MLNKAFTFLNENVKGFLSLIYPNNCVVCGKELPDQMEMICFSCLSDLHYTYFEKYEEATMADELFWGRVPIEHAYSMLYYQKETSTQRILYKIKYQEGQQLGEYMGERIAQKLEHREWINEVDAIVPIPLHSKKNFKRGYNQSLTIAKGFSEVTEIPIKEGLARKRHHASQTKKSKEERWQNVKSIFQVNYKNLEGLKHVVIVDDVLTTGSTLESAAKTIKAFDASIKISLVTIAIAK
jgi:ComF family protein